MDKNLDFLKKLSDTYYQVFKDKAQLTSRQQYSDYCKKKNANFKASDFQIEKGHKLDEYCNKYLRSLKNGKTSAYTANQLFLMKKKTKYWEIPNETDLLYFEIPSFHHR